MRFARVLVAATLALSTVPVRSSAQAVSTGRFVSGEILMKFRPGIPANTRADVHRQARGAQLSEVARTGVVRVGVPAGDESAAIARYRRNPNVLYAEPNFIRSIPMPVSHTSGSEVLPGDYYFDEQWALQNTGQEFYCFPWIGGKLCLYVGTPDADIDAPEAWVISMGANVKVAVIDSGVDYQHPDLAANYAGGYDFFSNDGDPMDDHGHGTHVAGTIAAAMNNLTGDPAEEEGVVGIAPHARFLAYKVCGADGTCSDFAIQQAIARAIVDGARVINMSLGSVDASQSLNEAVQDAWDAGLVIVAGAGNNGTTDAFYPAAFEHVISVAAFDEDHRRASFSNYGSWVDMSAPGNVIMSTYPLASCAGGSAVPGDTGCYNWNSGTSMATPHVAGAAALVWSRGDVTTNSQVVDIILNSADPQGLDGVRLDSWTIHGGLNLHDALSHRLGTLAAPIGLRIVK
jgi:thermitase